MAAKPTETRSVYLVMRNGQDKIIEDIPANAKVTFSKLQPGVRDFGSEGNVLRIYTTESNQLAVFTGVTEFRDLSLRIKERKVKQELHRKAERGREGSVEEAVTSLDLAWEALEF